jgi:hypothetical protein
VPLSKQIAGHSRSRPVRERAGEFLSVLDAQRSLYGAEDRVAESETLLATNLIAVYKALGGGWRPEEPRSFGRSIRAVDKSPSSHAA